MRSTGFLRLKDGLSWSRGRAKREGQEEYARQNRLVARKDMPWDFKERVMGRMHVLSAEKWGSRYNGLIETFDEIFRKQR